jgi:hypothetical protein
MISEIFTWQILCCAKLSPDFSRECESSLQVIHKQFSRAYESSFRMQLSLTKVLLAIFCDGKAYVLLRLKFLR